MIEPRLQLAEALFDEFVCAPADQRSSLLAVRCAGDGELRTLVEQLLANDDSGMGDFLHRQRIVSALPPRIGRYEIISEIGRGGSGVVYEARQENPPRPVALKVIATGFASPDMLRRFAHEAEILGCLQHPGIAQIFEAGTVETRGLLGTPTSTTYFAMELVRGDTLTKYATHKQLDMRARLELMACVCDAVQYAHQKGLIHRDLKPSNILVDTTDDRAKAKIIDFGIARAFGDEFGTLTLRTEFGQLIGTVPYMSPEQLTGDSREVDTRSDVYALGVVLFELVSGALPHDVAGRSLPEAIRIIREQVPRSLSTLDRALRGEIETICAKAMHRNREQRYQSASELSADIRHYLAGEPIEAKCDSIGYVLRKRLRRHWVAATVAASFIALLAGGFATSLAFWYQAERALEEKEEQRKLADEHAEQTREVADFQRQMLARVDPQTMGLKLRADLLAKTRSVAERSHLPPEEIEARIQSLEKLIAGIDLTGMATTALYENIFQGALAAIDTQFADQPLVKARLLQTVANTLHELGLWAASNTALEQALEIRRRVLGDDHQDTLTSIGCMCQHLTFQSKISKAESYCREALERRRRLLGNDHPDTLTSMDKMGDLLFYQGKLVEGEAYSCEALLSRRRVLGDDHYSTLQSNVSMGDFLRARSNLAEAERNYREAMESGRRRYGYDSEITLNATNALAGLLGRQGRLPEAEVYSRMVLEAVRRVHGHDHFQTLGATVTLGLLLLGQDKLAEAESYFRGATDSGRRVLGEDHPSTVGWSRWVCYLLDLQGKLDEAEPCYRQALESCRRVLGEDDWRTLMVISNLGRLLEEQGRSAEALALLAPAEPAAQRIFAMTPKESQQSGSELLGCFLTALGRARLSTGAFNAAEANLIAAHASLNKDQRSSTRAQRLRIEALNGLVELYDAWHSAVPDHGYDAKAADWRDMQRTWQASTQPTVAGP